jgi:hypothetical protein
MELKQYDKFLKSIYYKISSPASFTSAGKIWAHIKSRSDRPRGLNLKKIRKWIEMQDTYAVHKHAPSKFKREPIVVSGINELWESDIIDLHMISDSNDGFKYINLTYDVFSKFVWLRPMKSRKAEEIKSALADVFSSASKPLRMRCDLEYKNSIVKKYLEEQDVHLYFSQNEVKSNYSERAVKSVKEKAFRYFYVNQTYRWIDVLQDIANSYNNTPHRSLGDMKPADVNSSNEYEIYRKYYLPYVNSTSNASVEFKFLPGDYVRVSSQKTKFSRAYNEQFSEQAFIVTHQIKSVPPRYKIQDLLGENIDGSFYEPELIKLHNFSEKSFKIAKVLDYRGSGRKKEAFVEWYGYSNDPRFNTWIPASSIQKYESTA